MTKSNGNNGHFWKLPELKSKDLGKLGPGMGIGAICGVGFGVGIFGGGELGVGFPVIHLGLAIGAGCGYGVGYGYGMGRGIGYDENRRHSNVGKLFRGNGKLPSKNHVDALLDDLIMNTNHVDALLDDLIMNTKRLVEATSKELTKWRWW